MSALALTTAAAALGAVVTLVVVFVPTVHFTYRSARAHLILENFDTSITAAVAILFYGRHRRSSSSRDLLVSAAFAVLTTSGVVLALSPTNRSEAAALWTVWVPLTTRLLAAGLVALAAADPTRRIAGTQPLHTILLIVATSLVCVIAIGLVIGDDLPRPLSPEVTPSRTSHPLVVGDPTILAAQAAHALLYGYAAVAFTRQAKEDDDALTKALAAGAAFATFARINYFIFPSIYSQWLYAGDLLRTAFYATLGVGAVHELTSYWNAHAEAAVFAERRRLARDLHDGAVQELGYIRTLARQLERRDNEPTAQRIAAAAERAMAEARHAIAALSTPLDEPLVEALRRAAGEIADRYDLQLEVSGAAEADGAPSQREAVIRIVREAVANAARHGAASRIRVEVSDHAVSVTDDGCGFDVTATPAGGYGLVSMRDRAEAIGGQLELTSRPGHGTTVRVQWHDVD